MGFRNSPSLNFLPACIKDGKLYCSEYLLKPLDLPPGIPDFPLQCNQIRKNNIACYLQNGDMEFVLRFSGTGALIQNKYLRRSFVCDRTFNRVPILDHVAYLNLASRFYPVYKTFLENGKYAIFSEALPVISVIDDFDSTAMAIANKSKVKLPIVYDNKRRLLKYTDGNVVEGKLYVTNGFKVIGGYHYV